MGSLRLDLIGNAELKEIVFTPSQCNLNTSTIRPPPRCSWLLLDGIIHHATGTTSLWVMQNKNTRVVPAYYLEPRILSITDVTPTGYFPIWVGITDDMVQQTLYDDNWYLYAVSSGSTYLCGIRVLEWSTLDIEGKKKLT